MAYFAADSMLSLSKFKNSSHSLYLNIDVVPAILVLPISQSVSTATRRIILAWFGYRMKRVRGLFALLEYQELDMSVQYVVLNQNDSSDTI